ncbi:MAG TPA: GGDEF domain-containing protein, partial [Pseudodesulfovibrio sp.]|nr:GGDEF domain-containing protein [Pseudodesulfovibrio sp.]
AFNMMLQKETRRFMRYGRPFSVMMIDVDGLKEVNDRYGHEAGNRLIMMTAAHIKSCGRKVDTVARYGGDEFIMLLPETESGYVQQFAERVRAAVEKTSCDVQGARLTSTVSIGVACCPADAISPRDLMDKADAALYRSKRAGRNQATLWHNEEKMIRQASSA